MLAGKHVYNASAAEPRHHRDYTRGVRYYISDHASLSPERVLFHTRHERVRRVAGHDGDQLAFVGYVKRVEPQDLARAVHLVSNRNLLFEAKKRVMIVERRGLIGNKLK